MSIIQYAQLLLAAWITMTVVFENTVTKNTKEFLFTVKDNLDGSYSISQVSFRIFPNGERKETHRQDWTAKNLQELREGEFTLSRQGKLFLDSQFWINKPA